QQAIVGDRLGCAWRSVEFLLGQQNDRIGAVEDILHTEQSLVLLASCLPERHEVRIRWSLRGCCLDQFGYPLDAAGTAVVVVGRGRKEAQRHDLWTVYPIILWQQQREAVHERVAVGRIERPLLRGNPGRKAEAPTVIAG